MTFKKILLSNSHISNADFQRREALQRMLQHSHHIILLCVTMQQFLAHKMPILFWLLGAHRSHSHSVAEVGRHLWSLSNPAPPPRSSISCSGLPMELDISEDEDATISLNNLSQYLSILFSTSSLSVLQSFCW